MKRVNYENFQVQNSHSAKNQENHEWPMQHRMNSRSYPYNFRNPGIHLIYYIPVNIRMKSSRFQI